MPLHLLYCVALTTGHLTKEADGNASMAEKRFPDWFPFKPRRSIPERCCMFFIYFIIFINVPTGAKTSVQAASLMGSFLSVNALWIRAAHDLEATYFPIKRPRVVRFLIF